MTITSIHVHYDGPFPIEIDESIFILFLCVQRSCSDAVKLRHKDKHKTHLSHVQFKMPYNLFELYVMRQTAMNTSTIKKNSHTRKQNRVEIEDEYAILCIACVTSMKYAVEERVRFAF